MIEHVEYFEDAVDTGIALQRQVFLQAQVDTMNRVADKAVARRETAAGARWPRACAADRGPRVEHIAAVGRGKPLAGAVEVQPTQLQTVSQLPDAIEHSAVALMQAYVPPDPARLRSTFHQPEQLSTGAEEREKA